MKAALDILGSNRRTAVDNSLGKEPPAIAPVLLGYTLEDWHRSHILLGVI